MLLGGYKVKTGIEHTRETIKKIRNTIASKHSIIWMLKKDQVIEFTDNLTYWAKQNNLSKGSLYQVADIDYKRKSYKGWTVKRFDVSILSKEQSDVCRKVISKKAPELLYKFNSFETYIEGLEGENDNVNKGENDIHLGGNRWYDKKTGEEYVMKTGLK
jgi:hypothetical protein